MSTTPPLIDPFGNDAVRIMPPFFGGLPYPLPAAHYHDTLNLSFGYRTDEAALERLVPKPFVLARPEILISLINNGRVDWLGGSGYNLLAVNVPVFFRGEEELEGVFGLVVWENRTAPILAGRDMQGVPKVYAEVENFREFPDRTFSSWAHLGGGRFADAKIDVTRDLQGPELEAVRATMARRNWFGWRYFPNVGAPGAALSHPVLFPQDFVVHAASTGAVSFNWNVPPYQSNPSQLHIIARLAAMPNHGLTEALLMRCDNTLRSDLARIPR